MDWNYRLEPGGVTASSQLRKLFLRKDLFLLFLHMLMSVCIFHVYVGAPGIQKRMLDPLELELEVVVIPFMLVPGIEPRSSGRATKSSPQLLPTSF